MVSVVAWALSALSRDVKLGKDSAQHANSIIVFRMTPWHAATSLAGRLPD